MKLQSLIALTVAGAMAASAASVDPLAYIETRIGTAPSETLSAGIFGKKTEEFGQCLPAVLVPHGMNFWTPQTRDTEKKCVAPYCYRDSLLQGFRNSHWIVGGCTQDYGSMTLMPLSGTLRLTPQVRASRVSHDNEVSTPAYYRNRLIDENITAEMTGTSRAGIFRFTYDNGGDAYVVVNPNSDEAQGFVEVDPEHRQIRGYNPVHRIYQGKGEPAGFAGYFVVQFDRAPSAWGTGQGDNVRQGDAAVKDLPQVSGWVKFDLSPGEQLIVRAASSFTDMEGALRNLQAELPKDDFDGTRAALEAIWRSHLSRIKVEGGSDAELTKFYSALYRTSFLPRVMNDADGRYPAFSTGEIVETAPGREYYDDFSMWDTYRALHPLLNIIDSRRSADMMQSLVDKYSQGGWLPIFPCWNSYTSAMIGDHAIAVIADAWVKGIHNFDISKAYEGMCKNAFKTPDTYGEYCNGMGRRAIRSYIRYGYIPLEDSVKEAYHKQEQVSRTLEYAFDDFALSRVSRALGKKADAWVLENRAKYYRKVIDPATGYAQGRHADGSFINDPQNAFRFEKFITEGVPGHYTWYVPHDQRGLMKIMGGRDKYVAKLDSMFSEGRYWHGNEPCHQIPWLFNFAGQPWKTQSAVRHVLDTEYLPVPGGLSGNDDAGQMSAWYVFGAMGFYPVCPATPYYMIGSPVFPRVEIATASGRPFVIEAEGASPENIYIQSATLDGKPFDRNYLTHSDLLSGATLRLVMGPRPNALWGTQPPPEGIDLK